MRAGRFLTCKMPSPAIQIRSPFFKCLVIRVTRLSRSSRPMRFVSWCSSANVAASWVSVIVTWLAIFIPQIRAETRAVWTRYDSEGEGNWLLRSFSTTATQCWTGRGGSRASGPQMGTCRFRRNCRIRRLCRSCDRSDQSIPSAANSAHRLTRKSFAISRLMT